jgi:phage repressor protein C with HTH and peptisase S24 domain
MEPGLYDGDTVVINTADTKPADGEAFAINYEGELLIKRLVRDNGLWWLSSDNSDQRKFPRKQCAGDLCLIIGKIVHKQSERI